MSTFHQSPAWKALRLEAKRRDGWRCTRCGSRVGLEVDHVEPRDRRPDLALVLGNLTTLCRGCHIDKTKAERAPLDPEKAKWNNAVSALCSRRNRL
jgi:5-methylcytosine-specific restriction endonuclease McrA